MQRYPVEAKQTPIPGKHTVKFDFAYDGGGVGKGGMGSLFIDGVKVGEGRTERTQPGIFSADETADVGIDLATPVVERIGAEPTSTFNGRIPKLVVEVKIHPKQDPAEFAKKLANPVVSLISVPFQNNTGVGIGDDHDGNKNTLNVRPAIPTSFLKNSTLLPGILSLLFHKMASLEAFK